MTFEEFFTKKRIDLIALQAGEPRLFSEFKTHFEQMGEKSFDHTKKYWFNKLRLQYHLAAELKPEKIHLENRLAEQTIAESILEEKIAAPSVGFKPRFKPGMASKPAEPTSNVKDPAPQDSATATPEVNAAEATGDQNPPFVQEQAAMQAKANNMPRTTDSEPAENVPESPATKPAGFKPRFNMKMAAPKEDVESEKLSIESNTKDVTKPENDKNDQQIPKEPADAAPKPAGFKPRFNMKMVVPKEEAESEKLKVESNTADVSKLDDDKNDQQIPEKPVEDAPKPARFKPRFNMKMVKPKPPEEE